ncbi:HDOD domain-containing protein [Aestuariibacter salexigens]|uniref:HDOD domain-containing protein n=1 Tax=Aestuariibacter salexigens TaxID=226010 RepID=UPI00041F40B5|nr:HDOD domain-containing protein [Aestuariibacter salexigens]
MHASEFAALASESFTLPEICLRIRQMLDDHASSSEDIGRLVSLDPSMSSKLLKLANSALFRFPSQVDSISKAVSIIGGEALYNLVMAETAASAFKKFTSDAVDLRVFWHASVTCGLTAKHLAKMRKLRGTERFFLMGLLHNVAELVVAMRNPHEVVKSREVNTKTPPWLRQQALFDFTFAQCSALILEHWNLPSQLYLPIQDMHDKSKALASSEIAVLHTAVRLSTEVHFADVYPALSLVDKQVVASLKLDEDDLRDANKFAAMEVDSITSIINAN